MSRKAVIMVLVLALILYSYFLFSTLLEEHQAALDPLNRSMGFDSTRVELDTLYVWWEDRKEWRETKVEIHSHRNVKTGEWEDTHAVIFKLDTLMVERIHEGVERVSEPEQEYIWER